MTTPLFLRYSPRLLFLLTGLLLCSCAGHPISSFASGRPLFDPTLFFAGHTHSWGIFENRSGQPRSIIKTTTDGHNAADGFHFEQDIVFENGKKSHRSWLIHKVDEHHYTATGTGIVGVAHATACGNAFHLDFTMDVLPGNPLAHLHMSQWMYLQPDGVTMINRDTLTKFGVIVIEATEQFKKGS